MATYHKFDPKAVDRAIASAKAHREKTAPTTVSSQQNFAATPGHLMLTAECISVTVQGGQVCLSLPLGLGNVCLPIPIPLPDGTGAQACLSICTPYWVPTGVKVTVSVNGNVVVQQTFGAC